MPVAVGVFPKEADVMVADHLDLKLQFVGDGVDNVMRIRLDVPAAASLKPFGIGPMQVSPERKNKAKSAGRPNARYKGANI